MTGRCMRWATAVVAIGLVLASGAEAAQSDGHHFPCTQSYAKRVAYGSGFVDRANRVSPSFTDPRYWEPLPPLCADFDGDGSDEMVFSLGSMGSYYPWAFFDLTSQYPGQATYTYPTLSSGRYPNHDLQIVREPGASVPFVQDTRRLFHPRDAHCCPTGGTYVRLIGFINSSYSVLHSVVHRPPRHRGPHPTRLSAGYARYVVATAMRRRFGTVWTGRVGGRIGCGRKASFSVRRCEVAWGIGDAGFFGRVRVALFERGQNIVTARAKYRITMLDEYCAIVLHKPRSKCVRHYRGHARV